MRCVWERLKGSGLVINKSTKWKIALLIKHQTFITIIGVDEWWLYRTVENSFFLIYFLWSKHPLLAQPFRPSASVPGVIQFWQVTSKAWRVEIWLAGHNRSWMIHPPSLDSLLKIIMKKKEVRILWGCMNPVFLKHLIFHHMQNERNHLDSNLSTVRSSQLNSLNTNMALNKKPMQPEAGSLIEYNFETNCLIILLSIFYVYSLW